jgi:hypothetical protein
MEGRISEVGEKSITYEGGTFSGLSLNPSITIIRRSVGADFFFLHNPRNIISRVE